MTEPHFTITNTILNNIVATEVLRKGITDLSLDSGMVTKLQEDAFTREIFHLAHLLGVNIMLKDARKIATGRTIEGSSNEKYLVNFRSAMEYIQSTNSSYFAVQDSVLLHLNKILIKEIADEWEAKYKEGQAVSAEANDSWGVLCDKSLSLSEVQGQTIAALVFYSENITKIHPLIAIPILIYKLIRIWPLARANRPTILAFAKFLFFKADFLINNFLPVTEIFDVNEAEFSRDWSKAIKTDGNITPWIESFTRGVLALVSAIRENTEKIVENEREKNDQPFLNLNRRQLKILRYLQNIPQVMRQEYVEMMDVSTMTAYRDLANLLKKGLLKVKGKGRGTFYTLATK